MVCAFVDLGKHFGGAENYLVTIIGKWIELENTAVVIVKKGSLFERHVRKLFTNIEIISVDYNLKDIRKIRRLQKNSRIDVIHVNGINSGIFINCTRVKIPRVTTVHSNAYMDRIDKAFPIRWAFVLLENICLRKSDKIIVVSDALQELLLHRGVDQKKIIVVYNGIEVKKYPDRQFRMRIEQPLKLCFVGRLERVKGCEYLLQALSTVKSLHICCDIYGDGSLRAELEKTAMEKGIADIVNFKGFSNAIREVMPQYDVLVLPSLYEAFPLTIPEAMNAGLIIVCSDAGGLPWIIRNKENGYIFASGNHEELASIFTWIYEHPEEQVSIVNAARKDFISAYTQEIMIDGTFSVLKSVVRN